MSEPREPRIGVIHQGRDTMQRCCPLRALAAKCEARGREVSRLQAKLHRQRVARKRAYEAKGKQPVPAGPTGGAEARVAEKCTCDDGSGVLCAFCLRTGQEEAQPAPSLAADRDEARKDAADYAYNLQQFRVQVDSLAAERDRLKRELADCDCALNRPCLSAIRTRLQVPPTEFVDDAVAACADERDRLQAFLDASRHANSILVGKFGKAERERDEANVARDATDKRVEEVQSELSTATRLNTKWMDEATNAKIAQEIAETRAQEAERKAAGCFRLPDYPDGARGIVDALLACSVWLRRPNEVDRPAWADLLKSLSDAIEPGPEGPEGSEKRLSLPPLSDKERAAGWVWAGETNERNEGTEGVWLTRHTVISAGKCLVKIYLANPTPELGEPGVPRESWALALTAAQS